MNKVDTQKLKAFLIKMLKGQTEAFTFNMRHLFEAAKIKSVSRRFHLSEVQDALTGIDFCKQAGCWLVAEVEAPTYQFSPETTRFMILHGTSIETDGFSIDEELKVTLVDTVEGVEAMLRQGYILAANSREIVMPDSEVAEYETNMGVLKLLRDASLSNGKLRMVNLTCPNCASSYYIIDAGNEAALKYLSTAEQIAKVEDEEDGEW